MIQDTNQTYPVSPFMGYYNPQQMPPWVAQGTMMGNVPTGLPGTTASTLSPGVAAFPGYNPAPLTYATNLPPTQAAQTPAPGFGGPGMGPGMMPGGQFGTPGMIPGTQFGGPGTIPGTPTGGAPESPFVTAPGSPTVKGFEYTQGWLRSQIGQTVRIEFLIGTNGLQDRRGQLLDVGIDYIIIRETDTDDLLLCDIYSIKFVTVFK